MSPCILIRTYAVLYLVSIRLKVVYQQAQISLIRLLRPAANLGLHHKFENKHRHRVVTCKHSLEIRPCSDFSVNICKIWNSFSPEKKVAYSDWQWSIPVCQWHKPRIAKPYTKHHAVLEYYNFIFLDCGLITLLPA